MTTLLLSLVLLLPPNADGRAAQTVCPPEAGGARRVVTRLLTAEDYTDARTHLGLPALSVDSFRVLTDARDASVCARLTQIVAARRSNKSWRAFFDPVYYQAGDFYLAALARKAAADTPPKPGHVTINVGGTPLMILDADLNIVATVGM